MISGLSVSVLASAVSWRSQKWPQLDQRVESCYQLVSVVLP